MADRSRTAPMRHPVRLLAVAAAIATVAAGCSGGTGVAGPAPAINDDQTTAASRSDALTVYSRDRAIAEPLFEQFQRQTGIKIRARWGDPITLAEQIIDDGADTPADVFYGPLSDALGSLSAAGRLATLPDALLDRVPAAYRSPDGTWVGTSGRAHVVFYNTDLLRDADLPDSVLGFTEPAWRGRIGWDPTSRSLQDVVTGLSLLNGEQAARRWLDGMRANAAAAFQGANAIVDAVAAGKIIQVGLGSHSYLYTRQADGELRNVAAKFYRPGAPGGLLNVAGLGIVKGTDKQAAAQAFIDFMLSPTAERFYAQDAFEIPLLDGVDPPRGVPTAAELTVPGLDVRRFERLDAARRLLTQSKVIG